ncbi:PDR/VanB family oxidoreductase [Celeribacter neptunius]|uniref:Vanillate O-demethylase ferredoxin subunit n=1 Tax=Celeribacter neptunius TaxID=588602 RepID=A0A1I3Y4P6_9RHOB|nr:PDR/VanB family oxidoreductase [Celeribacter neptunius]SFK26226.1 vanillate O-demethylase ferredoxin subunit [Celeribacter neptunius]
MIEAKILKRETQARDIVVLDLVATNGTPLPAFEAGAHIDVEIEPGLTRQYSLCGDPTMPDRYRIGVLKDPNSRGGSTRLHELFAEGQVIRIGEPRNLFPLDERASESVLLGGGIGITPMIAMAYRLQTEGKPFTLHYCARERATAAFLDELTSAPFADKVHFHFDSGEGTDCFDATDLPDPDNGAHVYTCGPEGFMTHMHDLALARGYAPEALHQEFFSADVDNTGDSFDVELAQSGQTVTVAEGQSIVEALAEIGVRIEVSCEQGICGTCLCDVLEGEPDHRDSFLTDEEKADGDQITLCCSRAKSSKLVLDL